MNRSSIFKATLFCAAAFCVAGGARAAPAKPTPADATASTGAPIHAVLTAPPNVPPPTHRSHPAKVIVDKWSVDQAIEWEDKKIKEIYDTLRA